jgi:predicted AAA+ superfamily ATPase
LDHLLQQGGFPEPYLSDNMIDANRWRLQYSNSMLVTDVFDFDKVQNIRAIKIIFELLRSRVGSTVSYQSLAEDAGVSAGTVKKYIEILEALYIIFRVTPFSKNIARSLLKEPKIYFFDTGLVKGDAGAQLENLVAVCLLKHVYAKIDYQAENSGLYYLRTKDEEEVDFALVKDNVVEKMIEVKNSNHDISKSLYVFHKKYGFPAIQLVKNLRVERVVEGIKVMKVEHFLSDLFL